jgi:hypothetical protein
MMDLFNDRFNGSLDIYRLNFGMTILIPKEDDDRDMMKFRNVILLNHIL